MLLGDLLDGAVVHEQRGVVRLFHIEFEEGLRAEGTVGRDDDALALGVGHQSRLREVRVVFDLEGGGHGFGVAQQVHEELAVEVADADGFRQTLAHEFLHRCPCFLDGGRAGDDGFAVVGEAGRVAVRGVDVFQGDGEVHDVEVEVVDAPVGELLFADGFDAVVVVEGVPELGDEEEVGAFDEAFFDGAGDALTALLFVAVV